MANFTFIPESGIPKSQGFTFKPDLNQSQAALSMSQSVLDRIRTGKAQQSQGQTFQNELTRQDPTGEQAKMLLQEAPPTLGAIGGGLIGGVLGAPLGPAGIVAGSAFGAGVGSSGGEALSQKFKGQELDLPEVAKTGAEFAALEAVGGPLATFLGKTIKGVGSSLAKAVIPKSMQESKMLQAFKARTPLLERIKTSLTTGGNPQGPTTKGVTAFEKGLVGRQTDIGIQAKREADTVWSEVISPKLKASQNPKDMTQFFKEVEDDIIKNNPERGRQKDLLEALEAMKSDYQGISKATAEEVQAFKEGWAQFLPDKAWQGKPIAGAYNDVKKVATDKARDYLYKELGPEARQAYIDYGNLKNLQQLGQKEMSQGTVPVGGTGTVVRSILDMALVPSGTIGGQTIYKVGSGIELIGKPGAKTVRDVVGTLLGVGRGSSQDTSTFVSPLQTLQSPK